ncbi:phosphate transport system permease protein [Gemmatimonadetes bacterium T265]|nr:phosphate transport system permease protein [Gemmatimonadetes bacterium T265]
MPESTFSSEAAATLPGAVPSVAPVRAPLPPPAPPPLGAPPPDVPPIADGPAEPVGAERLAGRVVGDQIYRWTVTFFAACIPILLVLLAIEVVAAGWPALRQFGPHFLVSTDWDPVAGQFGAGPAIFGTVVTSLVALVIATPLALGVAVFISELAPGWLRTPLGFLVDLLAAVPSVVYGLWGVFVLVPLLREHVMPFIQRDLHLGNFPLFTGAPYGPSLFAAGVILAVMVLPYISSVSREVLLVVPRSQREAALALGATRWETIRGAVVPYAKSGIIGGIILGLGRALGETMAVTMVIGNRQAITASLFKPGYTMASLIANEFSEASGDLHLSALMAVGVVLFAITLLVNAVARWLVWRVSRAPGARAA